MKPKVSAVIKRKDWEELISLCDIGKRKWKRLSRVINLFAFEVKDGILQTKMRDASSSLIFWIIDWTISDDMKGEAVWILSPAEIKKDLGCLDKDSDVTLVYDCDGREVTMKDNKGSYIVYPQDDIDTVSMARGFPTIDEDGYPIIRRKRTSTKIVITTTELEKVIRGMDVTKTDYVEFNFNEEESYARLGFLGDKLSKRGRVPLYPISFEGEELEFVIPGIFKEIFSTMSDEIEIFGSPNSAIVIFKKNISDTKSVLIGLSKILVHDIKEDE